MNILKHMEAVFVATIAVAVLAVSATYATGSMPEAQSSTAIATAGNATMPVVVVSAKRLSADEKLQSLREERKLATARDTQWYRT